MSYGPVLAVDRLSLAAGSGQVLALLGPNGAGKTSTVETLEGYRRAAEGSVRVLGLDPQSQHRALAPRIGVMLQRGGVYPTMAARRAVELFASYYREPEEPEALLELVGLSGVARTPWRRLSGGEQQRLSLALALVGRPQVVFLDEPTAGVDPEGRIAIRSVIASLRDRGTCVLLTTHELPEAERLADMVVIIARGRSVARGTVAELAASGGRGAGALAFSAPPGIDTAGLAAALEIGRGDVVEVEPGRYSVREVSEEAAAARIGALAGWLAEHDLPLAELHAGGRSLEDVYLEVTRDHGALGGAPLEVAKTSADGAGVEVATDVAITGAVARAEVAPKVGDDASGDGVTSTPEAASVFKRLVAQCRAEVGMTLRRGESLLLTIGIPVVLLLFFSEVHILPVGTPRPVDFLAPGILALAVMSTSMVNLSIATGFERGYGVLKRLGSTPLGRPSLLGAKIAAILVVELLQVAVLVPVSLGLGWHASAGGTGAALAVVLLATAGFGGTGLLMAGLLRAEVNLAAANGLWLLLLLVSGILAPLSKLPGWLEGVAKVLPAAALAQGLHDSLGLRLSVPTWAWVILACWAALAPAAAALTFRWE
ncbi:MAG TPA: ATP-binding cassette domain-containing protein [Acidimicrobiales bacterium]|nr:ATP-binding cassette domain-containing protein [Acidimicrobiales bacterium]